ncbi:MAG: flagellar hook-length control protein FliK [Thermomonas haemolytica]
MGEPASLPLPPGPLAPMAAAGKLPAGEAAGDDAPVAGAFQQLLEAEPSAQADAAVANPPALAAAGKRLPAKPGASAAAEAAPDDVAPMMAMLAQMPGLPAAADPAPATPPVPLPNALPAGPVTSPQAVPDALTALATRPSTPSTPSTPSAPPVPSTQPELPGLSRDAVADAVEAALRPVVADGTESAGTPALPASLLDAAAGGDGSARRLPPILRTASPGIIPPAPTDAPRLPAATAGALPASALFDLLRGGGASSSARDATGGEILVAASATVAPTAADPTSAAPSSAPGSDATVPLPVPPGVPMPWLPAAANGPGMPIPPVIQADTPPPALAAIVQAAATMAASGPVPASNAASDPAALMQALETAPASPRSAASDAGSGGAPGPGTLQFPAMLAATALHATPTAPAPAAAPLAQPIDPAAGYDDSLGDHLAWMAAQKLGHAQIRVAPEHLGPIDIRVQIDGREVRAEFHSPHAEVRQALESSLPRLRELLGQQGLQLAHAGVGQGQTQGRRGSAAGATGAGSAAEGEPAAATPRPPESRRGRGLLDEYA